MCRNIKQLHNFEPPATDDEVHAAALQYVRKISGTTKPSKANEAAFDARSSRDRPHLPPSARRPRDGGAAEGPGDRSGPRPRALRGAAGPHGRVRLTETAVSGR